MTDLQLPPIVKREEWARRFVAKTPLPVKPATAAVIHHAVSALEGSTIDTDNDGLPDSFENLLRGIEDFHLDSRGWQGGIAYSILVGHRAGRKAEGRGWGWQSGATGNPDDRFTVSICAVGNYHDVHDVTDELVRNIAEVIAEGIALGHLVPLDQLRIYGHQEKPFATACPGQRLMARLNEVRPMVAQILEGDDMPTIEALDSVRVGFNRRREADVKIVQDYLRAAGFKPGRSDGVIGPMTERALIQFGIQGDPSKLGVQGFAQLVFAAVGGKQTEPPIVEVPVPGPPADCSAVEAELAKARGQLADALIKIRAAKDALV